MFRAQNDPLIHDADAPDKVFREVAAPNQRPGAAAPPQPSASSAASHRSKVRSCGDVESELGFRPRGNEGEAANHGVFFDDVEYDYMQHLRDLGASGDACFIDAAAAAKDQGKPKQGLADALRRAALDADDGAHSHAGFSASTSAISSTTSDVFGPGLAPSDFVRKTTYQDQQDVPDAIAGLQPDMDPRLREALEALDDDAFIDDEEDMFAELAEDPVELADGEWETTRPHGAGQDALQRFLDADQDDGWASDDTVKPASSPMARAERTAALPDPLAAPAAPAAGDGAWLSEFHRFQAAATPRRAAPAPSDRDSSLAAGIRRRAPKSARTAASRLSTTSSARQRTEQLTLLDRRFAATYEAEYADTADADADDDDAASLASGASRASRLSAASSRATNPAADPGLRADFDAILDDFLDSHSMAGKRRVKRTPHQSGLDQLDEIRQGLGPARVRT